MEKMYHVGFDDTHGAKYVILPGDPGRVEKIAQFWMSRTSTASTANTPPGWAR